jgi:hypothetical protein
LRAKSAGFDFQTVPPKMLLIRGVWQGLQREIGIREEGKDALWLRSGFCSTAARAGKTEHQIMKQTRHKRSDSLQRYIKHATLFDDNAAGGIGL